MSLPPIATPTYGAGGNFTIACSTRIPATPTQCLDVVLDAPDYPKWNTFCRKCTIDVPSSTPSPPDAPSGDGYLTLGTKFTFDVHTGPAAVNDDGGAGRPTPLELSVLERIDATAEDGRRGWRVAWRMRPSLALPGFMLRAERIQEFVEAEDGNETDYACWETFYGVLAPVVRLAVGSKLTPAFDAWNSGLKARVEELRKGGK
ncbi:hypothetical protein B0T16DRAFT_314566 [Cercophora newfieldiana]|uniref:Polyketide cyclase/dehydrase n=1 Tax=Cercophora newfieldiana TaxID=92897 RepID=A0AA39YQG2_9PEZI|nr:hypothetical protein B0T16DRAFT_314566 [Cercophora newfieldiana]